MINRRPVPIDALEFDPELATGNVYYDLAFLLMDLDVRGPVGMNYNPFNGRWTLGADARINYLMTAAKRD